MRAPAPFPVLLSAVVLLLTSILLPATLLAKEPKNHAPKGHRAAHHPKAVHPRSNVHKAGRHPKPVSLPELPRHRPRTQPAALADAATESRVHAWVKNQNSAADEAAAQRTLEASPDGSAASDPAKPVSVVSEIRNADTTGANKPQLPPVEEAASEPVILPTLYNKRGRLIVPAALKGSHEILIRQNQMADSDGLDRIHDDEDLDRMRRAGTLVPLPVNGTLHVDDRLPANRRYCRPWTALFLDTLARQHYAHFQTALQVNSAVRTVEFQQRLIHTNGNAAPAEGDTASPHLTGQAVDIAKRGLSLAEIAWLRGYLLPLVQQGKVDVEEEFQQSCFHISVYKKYMPQGSPRRVIATTHREGMNALGMGLQ
jgi:hypothetical protein